MIMELFAGLVDERTLAVLDLFLNNPKELYHINQVSELTEVPVATTFRIMKRLKKHKLLTTKKLGKFHIYMLADNAKTEKLRGLV